MFKQVIAKVGKALDRNNIPYMVIGGQAVLSYGVARLTNDIDITLGINSDRLADVLKLAKTLNLKIIPDDVKSFVSKTMVLPALDRKTKIRIDFIFSFTPYEEQAIKRARKIRLGKTLVRFASLEDIIIHKIFSGRPKDIEDVKSIIVKHPGFNRVYIKKWLKEFDSHPESGRELLETFSRVSART